MRRSSHALQVPVARTANTSRAAPDGGRGWGCSTSSTTCAVGTNWWWAAFLIGSAVQQAAGRLEPGEDLDAWHGFYATSLAGDVLWAIAGFLAAWIVGSLVVRLSHLTGYRG